jgi:hypothetical protein
MKNQAIRRAKKQKSKTSNKIILLLLLIVGGGIFFQHLISERQNYSFADTELLSKNFSAQANQTLQAEMANQYVPLILQRDERWGKKVYGSGEKSNTFADNGCAIASLAMIDSFWSKDTPTPDKILDWAGNQFFLPGQGTSWQIFPQFAEHFGYQFLDLGNSFDAAYKKMEQGMPVIISVQPGTFTTTGHLMVLALTEEGTIQVLDPNDSPEKAHYKKTFSKEVFEAEGLNYWCFWL